MDCRVVLIHIRKWSALFVFSEPSFSMAYSNRNPIGSSYTYVMLDNLRTLECIDTKQDGFYDFVKSEGYDFNEVREELLNAGLVMDLNGMISCPDRIFCGECVTSA